MEVNTLIKDYYYDFDFLKSLSPYVRNRLEIIHCFRDLKFYCLIVPEIFNFTDCHTYVHMHDLFN